MVPFFHCHAILLPRDVSSIGAIWTHPPPDQVCTHRVAVCDGPLGFAYTWWPTQMMFHRWRKNAEKFWAWIWCLYVVWWWNLFLQLPRLVCPDLIGSLEYVLQTWYSGPVVSFTNLHGLGFIFRIILELQVDIFIGEFSDLVCVYNFIMFCPMTIYSYSLILLRRRSRRRGRYSSDHRPIFALLFGTCLFIYIHSHIGIEYANGGCWWENVSENESDTEGAARHASINVR